MRQTIIPIITLLCLAAPATAQRTPSDNDIAQAIIRECLAIYHAERPCACPEDAARNGSRCGRRSAYIRPGGAHLLESFPSLRGAVFGHRAVRLYSIRPGGANGFRCRGFVC